MLSTGTTKDYMAIVLQIRIEDQLFQRSLFQTPLSWKLLFSPMTFEHIERDYSVICGLINASGIIVEFRGALSERYVQSVVINCFHQLLLLSQSYFDINIQYEKVWKPFFVYFI